MSHKMSLLKLLVPFRRYSFIRTIPPFLFTLGKFLQYSLLYICCSQLHTNVYTSCGHVIQLSGHLFHRTFSGAVSMFSLLALICGEQGINKVDN